MRTYLVNQNNVDVGNKVFVCIVYCYTVSQTRHCEMCFSKQDCLVKLFIPQVIEFILSLDRVST